MYMRFTIVLAAMLMAGPVLAHPPVSVVFDSRGNLYYSDLTHVWRVAPNGNKAIVVRNVHTHELHVDADDNLFGEHLWYEGEETDEWGHYVWRRSPDGRITKVIPPRKGFLTNYSFVRDAAGNMYWADRYRKQIRMRTPNGRLYAVAGGMRDVRWMHATADGTIYLVEKRDLLRVRDGRVTVLVPNLAGTRFLRPDVAMRHAIMGIWSDADENVYVADYAHGEVKRITPNGRVSTVAESRFPWSPTGGGFAPNGDLWILETSVTNAVRVRRVDVRR